MIINMLCLFIYLFDYCKTFIKKNVDFHRLFFFKDNLENNQVKAYSIATFNLIF